MGDHVRECCAMPPHPDLLARVQAALAGAAQTLGVAAQNVNFALPRRPGMSDGIIIPQASLPLGTSLQRITGAARAAPPRGTVRALVVLVEFPDRKLAADAQTRFSNLFFSTGVVPTGSVRDYYAEVSGKLVTIAGQVVGPFVMPHPSTYYADKQHGFGSGPNEQDLAQDAVNALGASFDFGPYDVNGDGYVDALIVVHAGPGGEETGSADDLWSSKWTLRTAFSGKNAKVYAYLTVPETARLGVCCHELGHLLFGFPDLYEIKNYAYAGAGQWCLMAGGGWNGATQGDTPGHPSAWCKQQQGWTTTVTQPAGTKPLKLGDVKASRQIVRVWDGPPSSQEYFLLETRRKTQFDAYLPGEGLLIWHIDDSVAEQTTPAHWHVGLVQADGLDQLEQPSGSSGQPGNRGDAGDPYPGSTANRTFSPASTPPAVAFAGTTNVAVTNIAYDARTGTATATVNRPAPRRGH